MLKPRACLRSTENIEECPGGTVQSVCRGNEQRIFKACLCLIDRLTGIEIKVEVQAQWTYNIIMYKSMRKKENHRNINSIGSCKNLTTYAEFSAGWRKQNNFHRLSV